MNSDNDCAMCAYEGCLCILCETFGAPTQDSSTESGN